MTTIIQPQGGCVISSSTMTAQPLCGWGLSNPVTQGSRSGNPGLEGGNRFAVVGEAKESSKKLD